MASDRLHVLLASDGIPPYVMGGMQKHSRLVAEYLAQAGVRVTLYHYVEEQMKEDPSVHFSPKAWENITIRTFYYTDGNKFPGHYLRAQKAMSQQYLDAFQKEDDVDFVFCKGFMGWSFVKHKNRLGGIPLAVKFHGMNMFQKQPDWKGELLKYMLRPPVRKIMNGADYIFSYGGKITSIIANELDDPNKIIEVPSGIERSWIRQGIPKPSSEVRSFLFVGRYDRLKGLPELYHAIQSLPTEFENRWRLTVVGPIPEMHRTLHPNVHYTGSIRSESSMQDILDDHDVLVCPSISEGMPNVIMEGMARGLYIVASDVGATNILVSASNGMLIEPGNVKELLKSLEAAINLPSADLYSARQNSLAQMKEKFTWETIGNLLVGEIRRRVQ